MRVFGTPSHRGIFDELNRLNGTYGLNHELIWQEIPKVSQKSLSSVAVANRYFVAIIKDVPNLICYDELSNDFIKIALNWQSLTKRIVTAGRKSEFILQACKLSPDMSVIDGIAGFGHDGLILASTGATVTMIEKNPTIALLLLFEHHLMSHHPNWQKLLSRIHIVCGDFLGYDLQTVLPKADRIYLDPMFPAGSYGAKVGKNMQLLHGLVSPPNADDERLFLQSAKNLLTEGGKLIIKRPLSAPHLDNKTPIDSVANDAIRFDRYHKESL